MVVLRYFCFCFTVPCLALHAARFMIEMGREGVMGLLVIDGGWGWRNGVLGGIEKMCDYDGLRYAGWMRVLM